MRLAARIALLAMFCVIVGCAITDYYPIPGHRTTGESKLSATEIAFSGFYPDLDGTYAYTAKYDATASNFGITIYSYHNPIYTSFTRDGLIDEDGDYIQGHSGILGGKFLTEFISFDTDPFNCGFFDNVIYMHHNMEGFVPTALCYYDDGSGVYGVEYDRDYEIHAAFANLDEMYKSFWSGATGANFTLDVTAVRIDGVTRPVGTFPMALQHELTGGPFSVSVGNSDAMRTVIQTILDNTENHVAVNLGFVTSGGMSIDLPRPVKVAFDHAALRQILAAANNPAPAPPIQRKRR